MRHALWSSLVAASLLAAPLAADTLFVPSPETGLAKGGLVTTLEVFNESTQVSGQLAVQFIPTGVSGATVTSSSIATFRPFSGSTFYPPGLTGGPGMLKITTSSADMHLGDAAFYLNVGNENAPWALPVVGPGNLFAAQGTAYIQDLRRNPTGVTNIEIINLASSPASCDIRLYDQAGVSVLPVITLAVQPQSHTISRDVLGASHITEMLGGGARVSCDHGFYAYGTFASPSFDKFRIIPPLTALPAAPGKSVVVNMPGNFFNSTGKNPSFDLPLPLTPGVSYRRVSIDFDLFVGRFSSIFNGVIGMFHGGGPRFGKTLYFGFNIRGQKGRILGDLGQPTLEAAVKRNTPFVERSSFHMKIIYDTPSHGVLFYVTDASGKPILDAPVGTFNGDLRDSGTAPVRLLFGLDGVADNAYFPPYGWKYSNLHVVATP
jgi:hypothetical protein